MAHDFNNLLTVITGYGELIQGGLCAADPLQPPLREIQKAARCATELTAQLLAFGRKTIIAPKVLDLNDLVLEAEKMLCRLIGEDVQLTNVLKHPLGRVKIDPGQMHQVIMNLAVNARDAMPKGGKLTITTANVELDASCVRDDSDVRPGPYVRLSVADTGHGMSAEVRAHVFEPFFTTKEVGKGTGLGLASVYGIVKQNGGRIEVESALGRGSVFTVHLPQMEPAERPQPAEAARGPMSRGSETVLLAEDEDALRAFARFMLQQLGYTVIEARNGVEAERLVQRHAGPIHLLVTDVVMPEKGGRELADALRRRRPHLKVLYMSGHTDDVVLRHGVAEETAAFLQKPFTPAVLAGRVRELLDR